MTDTIRLIIAGSRDFNDYELLEKEVDKFLLDILEKERDIHYYESDDGELDCFLLNPPSNHVVESQDLPIEIVSGGARGADKLGESYAKNRGYKIKQFIPDWEKGKSAGMVRNLEMLKYASHAIIFWDGISKGSKHSIDNAKKYNVKLRVIGYVQELLK